jgi:hypothetical protein
MSPVYRLIMALCVAVSALIVPTASSAQQVVYDDALENGWQNYGWATLNYSCTSPVQSGSDSISVTSTAAYQAMYLHHAAFDSTPYAALTFWINGGATGGQSLQVQATINGVSQVAVPIPVLAANTWQQITIPLASLNIVQQSSFDGFWIQSSSGTVPGAFYVDNIQLTSAGPPPTVNVAVNAASPVKSLDTRLLGLNTAIWDGAVGSSATEALIQAAGFKILRWPGGSASDAFNWSTNKSDGNTWSWGGTTGALVNLATTTGATAVITVNYGSGTPQMAAAWVAYFNGSPSSTQVIGVDSKGVDWKTVGYWASLRAAAPIVTDDGYNFLRVSHPASVGFKQYEIGNECYGSWENDTHGVSGSGLTGVAHDPYTYAQYAAQFISAMKAVDSTIKIGCVAVPGEDSYGGGNHSVANPNESNTLHSGWTPVVLYYLHQFGYVPDFIIEHRYPEAPGSETDSGLLANPESWPADATDLRTQITNYLGAAGANIELDATETNCVYSNPGKQSVSLVNALFAEDSLGVLGQTEFRDLNWWDMRNGYDPSENNSSSLYGWRAYGDYGLLSSPGAPDALNTPYPPYYAFKLASHWITQGAATVATTSSYPLLTAYGATQADGSLSLLVINKSPTYNLNAVINVSGFVPSSSATLYSYGKANDLANGDLTTSALSSVSLPLSYTFPSYSMTVFKFSQALSPPTIAKAASANPNPVTGTSATLSVLGADTGGEPGLTYTWAAVGTPLAAVTFSVNQSNSAKVSTATFSKSGTYSLQVTVKNAQGLTVTSSTTVTVAQTPTKLTLNPSSVTLAVGAGQNFVANEADQFGSAMTGTVTWSASKGSVSATGAYTAPSQAGTDTVTAVDNRNGTSATANVTINSTTATAFPLPGTGGNGTLAVAAIDPNFTLVATIPGTTVKGVETGKPVVTGSVAGYPGPKYWLANVPGVASWISPHALYNGQPGNQDVWGTYIYEQKFALPSLNPATVVIKGAWAGDNKLVGIYVNGKLVNSTTGAFSATVPFTLNTGFVAGTNTLDFVVYNTSTSPTGVFVEYLSATAAPM